jgi:NAD(P)-dependent dehydrogenase (short-subunit alcohol dehydrogenase family)
MRLAGKMALISGAGGGIGRETALLFAHEGARVAAADLDVAGAEETAERVREAGGTAVAIAADVSEEGAVQAMVREAEAALGGVNVMFNNAGIMLGEDRGPEDTPVEAWNRTLAVNLTGVFLCCKYGIPALLRAGGGTIVNMGSIVAHVGSAVPQIAYCASKGGVVAMTREIAVQYARQNVRANALCPGPIDTGLAHGLFDSPESFERRRMQMPLGRLGRMSEVAAVALFLASDESSYVTGATYLADGGIAAAYVTPE